MKSQRIYFGGLLPLTGEKATSSTYLLVLILISVWYEIAGQTPPEGFRYVSYEVTIPRKLTPRYGQEDSQDISYLLQIERKGHMVHLRQKKGFLPKHFPIFTYNKAGERQVDYPFIRDDCFYNGFVQGQPSSQVTLSTCSGGLRGVFQFENMTYEIEPVEASATFQHVVFRLEEKEGAVRMRCGVTEEEQRHQEILMQNTGKVVSKRDSGNEWWTHIRYAEVAIVMDFERFVRFNRNETTVVLNILDVFHTALSFYDPLSVQLSLVGLEIWSEKNLINISNSMGVTLQTFSKWQRNALKHLPYDAVHLFIYKHFGSTLGLAYVGTICNRHWGTAVDSYMTNNLLDFSVTFAHELGHNLGMKHDEKHCRCDRDLCIMSEYHARTDKFSNCSYRDYFKHLRQNCLLIPPDPEKLYAFGYCGNKVVENGEQCDCGSEAECKLDPCCQSNCMLRLGATCAFGPCCKNCQYVPARSICRKNISICDLPEYCRGTSEWCPDDVYVQDGAPCRDGAYCYQGDCTTYDEQCKMIFGAKAKMASEDCFKIMNAQGDRFGNCGLKSGVYSKCNHPNILCGRIQCGNVDDLPSLEDHTTIIQSHAGSIQCWGLDYHSGIEIPDIGAVRDGTPCGTDMMCIGGECLRVSLLNYDCNVTKCHNRGICNSRKHCHCDHGWAPPDCLREGYGGSIDSGPASKDRSAIIAETLLGALFALSAITIVFGVGMYYVILLRHQFRRLSSIIHPEELTVEKETPE